MDTTKIHYGEYDSFGFRVDTLQIEDHQVKRNESLYLILNKYDFTNQEIYNITKAAQEIVDVRSFKPGQRYRTYASKGNSNELSRLVWQPSLENYVVFDLSDSLQIYESQKQISIQARTASATIENSLYETMLDKNLSPLLAYRLSDIFAWEIDFFRLRDGDAFKVIYEEKYLDDSFYSIGEVLAVEFKHRGDVYYAYKFEEGDVSGYYDEEGNSVQKALLKAPFKYGQRISSGFSHNRFHPVLKRRIPHYGVDYAAPHGTPVLAVGDGTIIESQYRGASGNIVKIRHNGTYETAYLHLSGFARGIRRGAKVTQGQMIGYVGKTGRVTGTHLDYRIYINDRPVNPLTVDLPASESVPDSLLSSFMEVQGKYQKQLDKAADPQPMISQK
ncbi:MAG: peptidoglycan DD-metalloendopeptidase family protein [Balneolaceae bacterium]|nr:peptidoglycan DD-metalloendopeptidase family protein [Balneolaceae bacterium]